MRKVHLALVAVLVLGVLAFNPFVIPNLDQAAIDIAAQPLTPFPTPTPRASGEIIYIVQEGDSLYRIAGIIGMPVEDLAALNGMDVDDSLRIGQELLLGEGGPELPTESAGLPSPTPTEIPGTATPVYGTGEICVLVFLDNNGDASIDAGEEPLVGGQVSVVDLLGVVSGEHTTDDDLEGHCFEDLENGDYTVSAAVPPEFNSTTAMNIVISLEPGDIKHVEFGAQYSGSAGASPAEDEGGRSTILGIFGIITLVSAGLLGYYAMRLERTAQPSDR
jgi:LysM repeat protein